MYCRLASKQLSLPNPTPSPLLFCCLLNDHTLILIHQNKTYSVYPLSASSNSPLLTYGTISTEGSLTHCRRIAKDKCLVLTSKLSMMVVLQLIDGKQMRVGQVYSQEGQVFNSLRNCVSLYPMTDRVFAITNHLEQNRTLHFTFYSIQANCSAVFPYEARSTTVQLPLSDQPMIVKCIEDMEEFALFEQQRTKDQEYEIKVVQAGEQPIQKVIDVEAIASKADTLVDVTACEPNGYYVFVRKQDPKHMKVWGEVFGIRLHPTQNYYTQIVNKLHNFPFNPLTYRSIVAIQSKDDFLVTSSFQSSSLSSQSHDNVLQVRRLSTGQVIEELSCGLKEIETGLGGNVIIDYGREIDSMEEVVFQVRRVITKPMIYRHFMDNRGVFSKIKLSQSLISMTLECL